MTLLPKYSFTVTEACITWAHVEAEIHFELQVRGGHVELEVTVVHHTGPFGDEREWEWADLLVLSGTVASLTADRVRIVLDGAAPVSELVFDPSRAAQDTMWLSDEERKDPPVDFWDPLLLWGWRRQAAGWAQPLTPADLTRAVASESPLPPVSRLTESWATTVKRDRLRFSPDGRYSVRRGTGYPLEALARFELRSSGAAWAIVFIAHRADELARAIAEAPASEGWYLTNAGRRPEYVYGWVMSRADAEDWLRLLEADIEVPRRHAGTAV